MTETLQIVKRRQNLQAVPYSGRVLLRLMNQAGEIAQRTNDTAGKIEGQSSIPKDYMIEGEDYKLSSELYIFSLAHVHAHK